MLLQHDDSTINIVLVLLLLLLLLTLLILHAQLYPDSDILLICFVLPYGYFWNVFLHIMFQFI